MHSPEYYAELRRPWLPRKANLIVIAESPPKTGKYFYDLTGKPTEPLFTALMESLVGLTKLPSKEAGLQVFRDRGCLLLDATYTPVDGHKEGTARNNVVLEDLPTLRQYLENADPNRSAMLLLVKANVCTLLAQPLSDAGYKVVNGDRIVPFPSNGNQGRFRVVVKELLNAQATWR